MAYSRKDYIYHFGMDAAINMDEEFNEVYSYARLLGEYEETFMEMCGFMKAIGATEPYAHGYTVLAEGAHTKPNMRVPKRRALLKILMDKIMEKENV